MVQLRPWPPFQFSLSPLTRSTTDHPGVDRLIVFRSAFIQSDTLYVERRLPCKATASQAGTAIRFEAFANTMSYSKSAIAFDIDQKYVQ